MLTVTRDAIDAIKAVVGVAGQAGLRISTVPSPLDGGAPALMVEPVPAPATSDEVIEAGGTRVYIDDRALAMVDGKVLDADDEGEAFRFSVLKPP